MKAGAAAGRRRLGRTIQSRARPVDSELRGAARLRGMSKATKATTAAAPAAKRRGRPPSPNPASEPLQLRATPDQRAAWRSASAANSQPESEWVRDGLAVWIRICERAAELGTNPDELAIAALEDHARVRAAVAELAGVRGALSATEARLFRLLAPAEWERSRGG